MTPSGLTTIEFNIVVFSFAVLAGVVTGGLTRSFVLGPLTAAVSAICFGVLVYFL